MSEHVSYTLIHPVKTHDKAGALIDEVKAITLRRPKGKDMRGIKTSGGMSLMLDLVGICGGLTTQQVDALDGQDVMALLEKVGDFLGVSPPTGQTS